ncbi:unnamed protein product [Phyllotreta striolata]|uniref:Carboxylic ester hydrolase n=1 Tax=Phyllotreta striolata TaxID=444603 RepID=A0A9N9XR55_PHYSR|nr:unnamed protein product [Phyllotreta striolata]
MKTSLILFINFLALAKAGILVKIPDGRLRGRIEHSSRNISFFAFQQIPYAKPPIGKLRFKDPIPVDKWNGVLDATKNTKFCYQQTNLYNVQNLSRFENEDCLYLNVYTPVDPSSNASLPVMFYIYGGGFVSGASNFEFFGPHYLMENGVVVVTINYRVGPFGFISTGDAVIPGNFGLKDQLLGLHWVRDNIAYFGGDPNKVTIFGQSAGGASVGFHLISRKSKGLFRAAISQSASILSPWAYQRIYKALAYRVAFYIDNNFDKASTSEELLKFLQDAPASEINKAGRDIPSGYEQITDGFLYTPVIEAESETAFITERMFSALENGHFNRVPLIIGICSEESITTASNMEDFLKRVKQFDEDVSKLVNPNMHIEDKEGEIPAGNAIRNIYTNGTLLQNNLGKAVRYYSDTSFSRGVIEHAQLQSKFSDVYFYQFSYYGKIIGDRPNVPGAARTGHSDDNYFIWATGNLTNLDSFPRSDVVTSERYRALFTNFAKYLDPIPEETKLLNVKWPKVHPDKFQYIDINETLTIKINPKGDVFPEWVDVYNKYAIKPYDTF